ncbi:AbiTii domain-containing protein [Nonomuraea endophytica]|uniref:AbiTii domain-containing protein n=1 Tax=Nonomuraea endophytica TaxID=714136 RepID=A0A7W8EJ88_9ACTN|nr:hypothetical protein [Nonomuraea endophytica]MBB5081384.1 hypothetical protein [Nonomuraea endophytica]
MTKPSAGRSRDDSLLAQIERDIIDPSTPLSNILLKCVTLGGHARSGPLRDWAKRELNGYTTTEDVPVYRKIIGTLWVVHVNRGGYNPMPQPVTPSWFPEQLREYVTEEVHLTESVSELEDLAAQGKDLSVKRPPFDDIARLVTEAGWKAGNIPQMQRVGEIYIKFQPVTIKGVVSRIRSTLAELVSEMRANMPEGEETPSADVTNQALATAVPEIRIENSPNTIFNYAGHDAGGISNSVNTPAEPRRGRFWPIVGWTLAFIATAIGTYAGLGQWLDWPAPWK